MQTKFADAIDELKTLLDDVKETHTKHEEAKTAFAARYGTLIPHEGQWQFYGVTIGPTVDDVRVHTGFEKSTEPDKYVEKKPARGMTRDAVLEALANGPLSAARVSDAIGRTIQTTHFHLSALRTAGKVRNEAGKWLLVPRAPLKRVLPSGKELTIHQDIVAEALEVINAQPERVWLAGDVYEAMRSGAPISSVLAAMEKLAEDGMIRRGRRGHFQAITDPEPQMGPPQPADEAGAQ